MATAAPPREIAALAPAMRQRLEHFVQACELARAILEHRPDANEVLQRRVPLSAEAEATWLRLCAEGRRARAA